MNLATIGIVFRKELLDTLRDRKTLIFMIAFPTLLAPGISILMARVTQSEAIKTQQRRLVVQCEAGERDRLLTFLRQRLALVQPKTDQLLPLFGPVIEQGVRAIAADLGIDPFTVLIEMQSNPKIVAHARCAEVKAALAEAQRSALTRLSDQLAKDDDAAADANGGGAADAAAASAREMKKFVELVSPLVTLDYVTAAEVAQRPAEHAAIPVERLPAAIRGDAAATAAAIAISERRIHAFLRVPQVLDGGIATRDDTVAVDVVYDSTVDLSQEAERRIASALQTARTFVLDERLQRETLPKSFANPVEVHDRDAASRQQQQMKLVATLIPYILILMCFVGALYPAVDLGAGEKERLTLETLLVAPASRFELATGKFGVIALGALVAGLLSIASLLYTLRSGLAPPAMKAVFGSVRIDPATGILCLALIAPLAATLAAVMLAMSIYAKSQKEAQSLMMPLQFLLIIPAVLSMIPTIELNPKFACIPVINVALAVRTILTAGGAPLPWKEIAIVFASTCALAAAALAFCARRFGQESVIFRS